MKKHQQILAAVTLLTLAVTLLFLQFPASGSLLIRDLPHQERESVGAELLNINTAGLTELSSLPGIGPVLAQRILDRRETIGPFSSVAELLEIEGLGEGKLEAILDLITTGGNI